MGVLQRARQAFVARFLPRRNAAGKQPKVTVVIPFFNVEKYLEECVASVLAQTLRDIEIILVDDGSTDRSAKIAEDFWGKDPRVTIVTQANAGPGAARNNGTTRARGRYLAFVDSDDRLPANSLELLVRSAERNSADIAVGTIRRFNSSRTWVPEWANGVHAEAKEGIMLDDFPQLLRNNYPVGKVYRRDFWGAQGLHFREGVIYEDQPLIAQMLLHARSINVLTDLTYDYRKREDRSSISQRPEELQDLRDRVEAWRISLAALKREASPKVLSGWYDTLYGTHIHWYLNSDSIEDPVYWSLLKTAFQRLRMAEPLNALGRISVEKRVALALLDNDLQAEMVSFRFQDGYNLGAFPSHLTDRGIEHHLPLGALAHRELPDELLVTPVGQLELRQEVIRGGWVNAGTMLNLQGYAYIPQLSGSGLESKIEIFAVERASGTTVNARMGPAPRDPVLQPRESGARNFRTLAYSAEFTLDMLCPGPGRWDLQVRVTSGPFAVTRPMRNVSSKGGLAEASAASCGENKRARLQSSRNRHVPLALVIDTPIFRVHSVELTGRTLSVAFFGDTDGEPLALHVGLAGGKTATFAPATRASSSQFHAEVTLPSLPAAPSTQSSSSWIVRVRQGSRSYSLWWAEGRSQEAPAHDGNTTLRVTASASGNLKIEEHEGGVFLASSVKSTRGTLRITGRQCLPAGPPTGDQPASATWNAATLGLSARSGNSREVRGAVEQLTGTAFDRNDGERRLLVLGTQHLLAQLPFVLGGEAGLLVRSAGRTLEIIGLETIKSKDTSVAS